MEDGQQRIQDLYNEIQEAKGKKRELTMVIKDAFENRKQYQELMEEIAELKTKKKEIETAVRHECASEYNDVEDLKTDIKDTKQVMSDLMWNELMKNNKIEIVDEKDNKYLPDVMVTLKKAG
ncbi:hypothetical protein HN858_05790 [Candidatus Falkowbacteria bacterium]|jgi:hypothetical protein|nr:hypothetical protein [Candidatus Falkowbacteria bacterium]MBT5502862.1 hypothetical protein [Candidatus Falkowbacteria bacterium]MBT6573631.1 hypothetical protein [Candidatus Falkowbacteria bacterium]MBT7349149.1 hypothetical protein [Candidatus Falkowbacteria bacterium]MBT7500102.1 hypothetical protein [Candidatus Falkowbacteria bacterium]